MIKDSRFRNKSARPPERHQSFGRGFTLVEIIIAIAILGIIASLGLFISMDFFRSYSFRSEGNTIVSILQKARSQSMNNIDQVRHGVHFDNPLQYVIFECRSTLHDCLSYADRDTSRDTIVKPNYGSTVSGITFDVIFDQLSGNCITPNCATTLTITATDNGKTHDIKVNSEGQIDW